MDKVFDVIATAPLGISALVVAVVLMGAHYILHVIPKFKEYDDLLEEKKGWEDKLNKTLEKLDKANDIVKKHVEESKTSQQLEELLRTCMAIQSALAESVRKTEAGIKDLEGELDSIYDKIMDIRRVCESDQSSHKFNMLDTELRMMSQQLATITNRLSSITGILIGNNPSNAVFDDMMHERKLK